MNGARALVVGAAALAAAGCATVSQPPVAVESPVPKAEQVAAQAAQSRPAAKRYKVKLAVGRFTNESNYGRSLLTDQEVDRLGKQASDMLASRLVKSGRFLVLERPDLATVEREQQLGGKSALVGADTLVVGSVTEFGRSVGGKVGFLSSTKVQTARAKVDVRLVDAKTGHAYFSATGAGEASTETGEVAGFGSRAGYDATLNDQAIAAAISDVIDRLVSSLSARPWRTDVLDVQGDQVFVSGGASQGLAPGDALTVMEPGKTVRNQSGFDVVLPGRSVASLRVTSLFGADETSEGAVCQLVSGAVSKGALQSLYVVEDAGGGR